MRNSDEGHVERAVRRMYERLGARVALVCIAIGYVYGLVTLGEATAGGARFLGLSASQAVSMWPVALVALILTFVGLGAAWPQIATVLAWSGPGRTPERAPATWYAVVQWWRSVAKPVLGAEFALLPASIYVIHHFDKPWYGAIVGVVAITGALASLWALTVFTAGLILRPMIEDVASFLPADFQPRIRGVALRTKTVGPLPVVTFFAALIVGAYANLISNPVQRAALATGVALATVVVATVIFLILNRSVLAPIDDLIAATERVGTGDIVTPVPVVSDDELGTLALSFNQMLEQLRTTRKRIVDASDAARRKVERDLHDGAQQQLVLAQLKLGMAERLVDSSPAAARSTLAELRGDLDRALRELRDLARGLYPSVLEADGLRGALGEAVQRAAIPATLDCDGASRYDSALEAAVYFCCLEALQNAAKHAGEGARAEVRLAQRDGMLHFEVADDGRGFTPSATRSHGLQNMADRIGALGGDLKVDSSPGVGTSVSGTIPLDG